MPHQHHSSSHKEHGSDESRRDNQNEEPYQSNYQYSARAPPRPGAVVHNNVDMSYSGPPVYGELPSPRRANPRNSTGSYQSNAQYSYRAPPANAYYSSAPQPGDPQYINPFSSGHYPQSSFPAYQQPSTYYQHPSAGGEIPVDQNYYPDHREERGQRSTDGPRHPPTSDPANNERIDPCRVLHLSREVHAKEVLDEAYTKVICEWRKKQAEGNPEAEKEIKKAKEAYDIMSGWL